MVFAKWQDDCQRPQQPLPPEVDGPVGSAAVLKWSKGTTCEHQRETSLTNIHVIKTLRAGSKPVRMCFTGPELDQAHSSEGQASSPKFSKFSEAWNKTQKKATVTGQSMNTYHNYQQWQSSSFFCLSFIAFINEITINIFSLFLFLSLHWKHTVIS